MEGKYRLVWCTLFSVLMTVIATGSQAALVTLTTNPNWDLTYDDATLGLYGVPIVSAANNNIIFLPNIDVTSNGTDGTESIAAAVSFTLAAKGGTIFDELSLFERGKYQLIGNSTSVTHSGSLTVTNNPDDFFAFSFDNISVNQPLNNNDGALHAWTANASALLGPGEGFFSATNIAIEIQNNLSATSTLAGELAFIEKDLEAGVVQLTVGPPAPPAVPVPPAVWLFGSGLLGLIGIARRKKAA
jgi:hypothetical protein